MGKNFSKTYQLILWTITLIVMVVGLLYHVAHFNLGFIHIGKINSRGNMQEINYNADVIDTLDVEMEAADFRVEYGSVLRIQHNFPDEYAPDIKVNGGRLTIIQHFDGVKVNNLNDLCSLIVTVPRGTELNLLKLRMNAGDIDIEDIEGDKLDIKADAGDIDITGTKFNDTVIKADAGDIDVKECKFSSFTIDAEFGDILVKDTDFDKADINVEAGDIDVEGDFNSLTVKCELGDINIKTDNPDSKNIEAKCSLGRVKVNGKRIN